MPRPESDLTPPALQDVESEEPGLPPPPKDPAGAGEDKPLFRCGPVAVRPHISYRFLYGDGIQADAGKKEATVLNEISPGILLGLGRHWTLDYTPTISVYSNDEFKNTVNHSVNLNGGTTIEDWVLGLSQSYQNYDEPMVETGEQTSQETYTTSLSASDKLGSQMQLQCSANQVLRYVNQPRDTTNSVDSVTDTREWSTLEWLTYQFTPQFSGALGCGFGYVNVQKGSDSLYQRPQARITWLPTEKLFFQVHGGAEFREFTGSDAAGTLINPIVDGSIAYRPVETTTISLNASHVVSSSDLQDQVVENTNFGAGLEQRLFGRLKLSVGFTYSISSYVSTKDDVSAGRDDDNYSISARLGTSFLKRGTVALFYQYSENLSNRHGYGYSSNQGGVELGYRY